MINSKAPAIARAAAILRLLGKSDAPLGVNNIARALDLVPSTCLYVLRALTEEELVAFDPDTKRYSLDAGVLTLARGWLRRNQFADVSQPLIDRLAREHNVTMLAVQIDDLLQLAARFVGEERARQSFIRFAYRQGKGFNPNQNADGEWIEHTERLLSGVLGTSSTRAVVKAAIEGRDMQLEDVVRIADEASEVLQFNRALLQGAIENITQGISVVDQSLRLVAWNHRYIELFNYPEGQVYVGRPVAELIRFNAERGLLGGGDIEEHVSKRLYWMRQGTAHTSERLFPNGRVIELIGNPMPGGGFVMSFTDITEFREAERALKDANEGLEQRVSERTQELSQLNQALTEAKGVAEAANQSKTRFLAAVSHDLMQPLNAARLFSAALSHQDDALPADARELVRHLDSSLRSAEDLISDLLDISRLENGRITPDRHAFVLNNLFDTLGAEFRVLAAEHGVDFRLRGSRLRVDSDIKLLRRILQNFLTNAFRYAKGRVLLGVRREGQHLRLEVWDRGAGIPEDKRKVIFEEFKRLDSHQTRAEKGLGLGLAIADGLCRVLGHSLEVRSWPGKGTVFRVSVPIARQAAPAPSAPVEQTGQPLAGLPVGLALVADGDGFAAGLDIGDEAAEEGEFRVGWGVN